MILESSIIGKYTVDIGNEIADFRNSWHVLQGQDTASPYQGYDWLRVVFETLEAGNDIRIIHLHVDGEPCMLMPLVVETGRSTQVRWPGKSHINIGEGLYSRKFLESEPDGIIPECLHRLAQTIDGPAVLHLKNQRSDIGKFANPLLELSKEDGPNPLFAMDISGGFDALLEQANGKRKRKAFRHQVRACEKLGGYEFYSPRIAEDIQETVSLFFEMKSKRLRDLGVRDVFESEEAQSMVLDQALCPMENDWQPMRLYVLKVGGIVRAIYGIGIAGKKCCAQINAVRYDEFVGESPGEMLIYLMVSELCEQGFEYFDLGIGTERYKKSWCKQEVQLFETIYPLADNVAPLSTLRRYQTRIKKQVKSNKYVWSKIKQLRKIGADIRR